MEQTTSLYKACSYTFSEPGYALPAPLYAVCHEGKAKHERLKIWTAKKLIKSEKSKLRGLEIYVL